MPVSTGICISGTVFIKYCTNIQYTGNLCLNALSERLQKGVYTLIPGEEVLQMKRFQKWFEQMAGVSQDELDRLARAREIFAATGIDISSLKKPACWRRKARIQSRNG